MIIVVKPIKTNGNMIRAAVTLADAVPDRA